MNTKNVFYEVVNEYIASKSELSKQFKYRGSQYDWLRPTLIVDRVISKIGKSDKHRFSR